MSTVGQIVYNLEDWHASGGYISTSATNKSLTISSWTSTGAENAAYKTGKFNIYSDIVAGYGATLFSKLGIQAPPGTKITIDGTKTIMIGRTGVYELDEDITISSLKFEKTYIYVINTAKTDEYINIGIGGMLDAETTRSNSITALNKKYNNIKTSLEYWQEYAVIQATYEEDYNPALANFNIGINGVYLLPNPDNPDSEDNYSDLLNVIIDFIY